MQPRLIRSRKNAALLLLSAAAVLAGAAAARGQSALDGFDPNANGPVHAVAVQADGKILLGGQFTSLSPNGGPPVARNHIARLNPDGTLDLAFDPNANGIVYAIAVQPDGKILVGGAFNGANSIGSQTRNRIARLDADAGLADSFNPSANNVIRSIVVQSDGKILVGGDFTTLAPNGGGTVTRNRIARMESGGTLDNAFDPNANGIVRSIIVQPDGRILAGGDFSGVNSMGGQTRNYIARLDATTGLADSFNPNANDWVFAIALQADGKILVGGNFAGGNSIGGATRNYMARLDATTGLADSFDPNADGVVEAVAVQADGKILVGGFFNFLIPNGGPFVVRNRIARLNPDGTADPFDPNAGSGVMCITVQSDGRILVGGAFASFIPYGGTFVIRSRIARLETDGRLDQTLNLSVAGGHVLTTAVQGDGKILIAGTFTAISGVTRNKIARLNTDGSLDLAFNPDANGGVLAIAVQMDGKILAVGQFTNIGGEMRNRIARLDPASGAVDSFNPDANNEIYTIALQADGKILVGGLFGGANSIGGQSRNGIARLDPVTGLADSFDPQANDGVFTMAVQADGKILAGGGFTNIGGQPRAYIARLDPTTGAADPFNPEANNEIYAATVQPNGRILVGGAFFIIGGQVRHYIARLDATTGAADSFTPEADDVVDTIALLTDRRILVGGYFERVNLDGIAGPPQTRPYIARLDPAIGTADSFSPNATNIVSSIGLQADGKALACGFFNSVGGQPRVSFARLSSDKAALQNLSVTQNTVTWIRSGSNPQLTRAVFEFSTDNVSYTPLGEGMPAGSNWTLTNLNLPGGQNIYIRARGSYPSGSNGSASITETVRNAFISTIPMAAQVVSRKMHGGTPYDIVLPATGTSGIECRTGGATNDYQVIFTFPTVVTFNSASITSGTGSVSSSSGSGTAVVTVDLTGVANAQTITVTLGGVNNGSGTADVSVPMGVLLGDTNGNGTVSASDVGQTKAQSGQTATSANFRTDVNASGTISASDVAQVKSQSGTFLPP